MDRQTDIDGTARLAGLGRRSLQRQLEDAGLTYSGLLERVRMARARALVEDSPAPLAEIGFDVGYSDPAHFSRAFRRHFGVAPSALRRSPRVAPTRP